MVSEPAASEPDERHDRAVESEPLLVGQDVFNTPFRLFVKRPRRNGAAETDADD